MSFEYFFQLFSISIARFPYLFVERYFDCINPQAFFPTVVFLSCGMCDRPLEVSLGMDYFDKYRSDMLSFVFNLRI